MKASLKEKLVSIIGIDLPHSDKHSPIKLEEDEILMSEPFIDENGARVWSAIKLDVLEKKLFPNGAPVGLVANYDNIVKNADTKALEKFKPILDGWKSKGLI